MRRATAHTPATLLDVLDRVLDCGIVIESFARMANEAITFAAPAAAAPHGYDAGELEQAAYARGLAEGLARARTGERRSSV